MKKILQVGYSLPSLISAYLPNALFAQNAAILNVAGYDYGIKDLTTLDTLIDTAPPKELRDAFVRSYNIFDECVKQRKPISQEDQNNYFGIVAKIQKDFDKKIDKITQELSDYVSKNKFDGVFFDMNREGYKYATNMQKVIKKDNPNVKIVSGGRQVIWGRERVLHHCPSDALIYGYLNHTIVDVFDALFAGKSLKGINNVIYDKHNGANELKIVNIANANDLPMPEYNLGKYPALLRYGNKVPMFPGWWSYGCPNNCKYCERPVLYGRKVYKKTPDRIVDELYDRFINYGSRMFADISDNFPVKDYVKVAKEILSRGLSIEYVIRSEVNDLSTLTSDEFDLLAKSGLKAVFLGAETGNRDIQKDLGKVFSDEKAKVLINNLKKQGIRSVLGFIYRLPGETKEGMEATKKLVEFANPHSNIYNPLVVFPGPEYYENREKYGIELAKDENGVEHPDIYLDAVLHCDIPYSAHPSEFGKFNVPYTINGESFLEVTKKLGSLSIHSSMNGMPVGMLEHLLFYAELMNMSLVDFKHHHDNIFLERDPDNMTEFFSTLAGKMHIRNAPVNQKIIKF